MVSSQDVVSVEMGSLQGSVLSPILFACFINDVCEQILNCEFHLYADDLQLTLEGMWITLVRLVNEDLKMIHRWCVDNSMVLNVSKTQAMVISRRDRGAGDVVVFPTQ
jgi:hypothetical protein